MQIGKQCSLDREVKFVLSGAQMLFGLGGVARHIVVIGGRRTFPFVNGLDYMPVNRIKILPIRLFAAKIWLPALWLV